MVREDLNEKSPAKGWAFSGLMFDHANGGSEEAPNYLLVGREGPNRPSQRTSG